MWRWVLAVSIGCGGRTDPPEPSAHDSDPPAETDTTPADDDPSDAPPDALTAEEIRDIEASVAAWAGRVQTLGVVPAWAVADRADALRRENCPIGYTTDWGAEVWEDICTTAAGVEFFGFALREIGGEVSSEVPDVALAVLTEWAPTLAAYDALPTRADTVGVRLLAGFAVVNARGEQIAVDGDFADVTLRSSEGAVVVRSRELGGPVVDAASGDWVAEGIKPEFTVTDVMDRDGALVQRVVDGAIGNLGLPLATVDADRVSWSAPGLGACDAEPTGVIAVRRADGGWWTLFFGGAACDGCAAVTERGVEVGVACPDLRALAAPCTAEEVVP